jgi:membrane protease YdiL (CAAX protease family)
MKTIKHWVIEHQVAAFFIMAFAITWGLGFSYNALLNDDQFLWFPVVFLSTCGPGLAGIIISAMTNTQPAQGSRKAFWSAFVIAWGIGLIVCLANLHFTGNVPLSPLVVGLFIVAVVPVAFIISSAYSRNREVRRYLSSLVQVGGVWRWSLLAMVMFPALFLICYPLNQLINKQPIPTGQLPEISLSLIGLVAVKFFYQLMFFNATGEETGWRGFALPRLQARTSPLMSGVMIGVLWAAWHFFGWKA